MSAREREGGQFSLHYIYHIRFDLLAGACVTLHDYAATARASRRIDVSDERSLTAYDLVSSNLASNRLHVAYVSLHAKSAEPVSSLLSGTESTKQASRRRSVVRTRANPVFINRFTRHGAKERALGGYAKSLAMIMLIYKRGRMGELQIMRAL